MIESPIVIGVDCSTDEAKTGLALAVVRGAVLTVNVARCASRRRKAKEWIQEWASGHERVLIALDAPLGWPAPLAVALAGHQAGKPIDHSSDTLFLRHTDHEIKRRFDLHPFSVGADRIARTAVASLNLLQDLRTEQGEAIDLAWSPTWPGRIGVIEVYPSATRAAYNAIPGGGELGGFPTGLIQLPEDWSPNEHAGDAIVCALAGFDFLRGLAVAPAPGDIALAQQEGWIWTANRGG